jgi:hypothetical protein
MGIDFKRHVLARVSREEYELEAVEKFEMAYHVSSPRRR